MSQPGQRDSHGGGRMVGRFEMFGEIATGGFAAIHLGRTTGAGGFSKLVAIKRLHSQFAEDPESTRMFLDEARVVARINHPNVVPILDFIEQDGELFMVMDYVEGVSLSHLWKLLDQQDERVPLDITLRVMVGTLHGLHAAHEARDERGNPLCVIHRDVSPDNILVGADGYARIVDFGVARALGRYQATHPGLAKGKLSYMTPEQVMGEQLTRRADVFSASVVMWECLTGRRLFKGEHMGEFARKVTQQPIAPPSTFNRTLPRKYDDIVMKGLERDPSMRWETTERMADAIETVGKPASTGRVGKWVKSVAAERIARRTEEIAAIEVTPVEGTDIRACEVAARASEGEDSFKAVATQVLRVGGRKRPLTEEGTHIMDLAPVKEPPKTSLPKTSIAATAVSATQPVAAPSHPDFAPVRSAKAASKSGRPIPTPLPPSPVAPSPLPPSPLPSSPPPPLAPAPLARAPGTPAPPPPSKPPPPPAVPRDPPATTASQPFALRAADIARAIDIEEPPPPLNAVSSVNPVALGAPRRRKLLAGLGIALGVIAVAALYVLEWRQSTLPTSGEPPAAAPAPEEAETPTPPAPEPEPPAEPVASTSSETPSEASPVASASSAPAAKPAARPTARVAARPRPRPAPAPPPPPPKSGETLFERE